MSASRKTPFSSKFLESYMHELMSMSDEDILEGEDIAKVELRAKERLSAASREAGRRRLVAAKAAIKQRSDEAVPQSHLTIADIRAYIVEASNDGRVTLAARQLNEMSEADARRLYSQLIQLRNNQGNQQ